MSQCRAALRTLGLDAFSYHNRDASPAQIKEAYLRLAKVHHPDVLATADSATKARSTAEFKRIANAYDTLRTNTRRLEPRPRQPSGPHPWPHSWLVTIWRGPSSGTKLRLKAATIAFLVGLSVWDEWRGVGPRTRR